MVINQKHTKADELFFVVDEQDRPLAPLPRRQVHGSGAWHRVSHIGIINDHGEVEQVTWLPATEVMQSMNVKDPKWANGSGYTTALIDDIVRANV